MVKKTLLEIDEKKYFKMYKDIVKFCLKEGVLLPSILEFVDVPEKYDFTEKEQDKLKISEEASHKRQRALMDREVLESSITFDGNINKYDEELSLLWNDELTSFINLYPQFNVLK